MSAERAGVAEWRTGWPLPFVAMIATTGGSLIVYSAGVFMPVVTASFGWSRGAFSSGFMVSTLVGLATLPLAGGLADRWGPRRVALVGVLTQSLATAALGLADGVLWHWWLLFALFSVAGSLMGPPILTKAIVSRFEATRGLALAVALSGNGLATAIWPTLATLYIGALGWRLAFAALIASWAVVTFPLLFVFFRARSDLPSTSGPRQADPPAAIRYADAIRSRPFLCLGLGGPLFTAAGVAILINLVPILRDRGLATGVAAGVAAAAGISAIAGRILVGFLLDRMQARPVAVTAFLLPAVASLILLVAGGSVPLAVLAAVLLGLGLGAEMDIATYLASRYFGLRNFSGIFGIIVACYAVAAGLGPMLGNIVYDETRSYRPLLLAVLPVLAVSVALIGILPRPPRDREPEQA